MIRQREVIFVDSGACNGGIDCVSQPLDDCVDRAAVDYEGRRKEDVVSAHAVDRSAHRVNHQSACHGFMLDPRTQLVGWIKRLFATAIGYDFNASQQAAAAQVTNKRMIAEPLVEAARKIRPVGARSLTACRVVSPAAQPKPRRRPADDPYRCGCAGKHPSLRQVC